MFKQKNLLSLSVFAMTILSSCVSDTIDGNPDYFRTGAFIESSTGTDLCYIVNNEGGVDVTWDRINTPYFLNEQVYEGEISVPASVTHDGTEYRVTGVDDYAFYNCSKLTGLTLPEGLKRVSDKAFLRTTKLTTLYLPTSVSNIDTLRNSLLGSMTSLVTLHLPGVKALGDSALYRLSKLTSVEIPSTVEELGVGAFARCSSLRTLTIPSSVKTIKDKCFEGASRLVTYHIEAVEPPTVEGTLYNASKVTLYVPAGSLQAYKDHPVWGTCNTITGE